MAVIGEGIFDDPLDEHAFEAPVIAGKTQQMGLDGRGRWLGGHNWQDEGKTVRTPERIGGEPGMDWGEQIL